MTSNEENKILMANFAKCADYVEKNFQGFPRNVWFEVEYTPYHWVKAAVTTDGKLILGRGNHSDDFSPSTFILNGLIGEQSIGSMGISYSLDYDTAKNFANKISKYDRTFPIEELQSFLNKWKSFKKILNAEKERCNNLANFEV